MIVVVVATRGLPLTEGVVGGEGDVEEEDAPREGRVTLVRSKEIVEVSMYAHA